MNQVLATDVAKALLSIKAVFLRPAEPFTWASGIKSPIYCDNRLTLSVPAVRKIIENGIASVIKEQYPDCEVVMGTSTAGIPHAAIVSEILDLPMGYVRGGNKEHGRGNRIEGADPNGKKVVVVEDLISTGGSAIEVVNALREAGANVLGIVSIFTYEMKKGIERLAQAEVNNTSLSCFSVLSKVALEQGYITDKEYRMVSAFQANPQDPEWINVQ
ncbi:MAG: orotate phosphoribosyltransferase [Clostridia bacterium]|nr:orotate phosphoribosyltransferase [Clostridia bacterium]